MKHFDLRRIDLNLLVTFDALMTTRSVTRAAERLGLGQPAVSHALARLREVTGDSLFVNSRHGLVPTSRAVGIAGWVRSVLEDRIWPQPYRRNRYGIVGSRVLRAIIDTSARVI